MYRVFWLFFPLTLIAQETIIPSPDKAFLMVATEDWLVWNVNEFLEQEGPRRGRPSSRNSFYLQKINEKKARLIYRDTIGDIQSFVPIWVLDKEVIVGWDGTFQRLRNGRIDILDFVSLPGSLYYPVLCGVMSDGVLMMTQNEQHSTDAYERVYFLPWSGDDRLVDDRKAVLVSDSVGIPFFWPSVKWYGHTVLTWRAPMLYRYDRKRRILDSIPLPVTAEASGPSHISAFDGARIVLQHGATRLAYDLESKNVINLSFPDDFNIFTVHGNFVYGVLGAALTKSDSLTYLFQAYDMNQKKWLTLLNLSSLDINQEIGFPACIETRSGLRIWSGGRWHVKDWLK